VPHQAERLRQENMQRMVALEQEAAAMLANVLNGAR
jgi:hypothetical protein